jgi:hypothetical protein
MSIIGGKLREIVFDNNLRNNTYYLDFLYNRFIQEGIHHKDFSYYDLFKKVRTYIRYINDNYKNKDKKVCFLIVNNYIDDIAYYIALLETGIKPIIINKDYLFELYINNQDIDFMETNNDLGYIHMPFFEEDNYQDRIDKLEEEETISNKKTVGFNYLFGFNEIELDRVKINKILNYYIRKNNIELINEDDYDFAVLTSGTTGNFKIQKIKEKDLCDKIASNYDLDTEEEIINLTPISAISGLIFNAYMPILSKKKSIAIGDRFQPPLREATGKITLVLPGGTDTYNHFVNYFNREIPEDLTKFYINHVYFIGKRLTDSNVKNARKLSRFLNDDCVYNLYGNTENLGLVCSCNQQNLVPIYIYGLDIRQDKYIYTLDKVNVFEKSIRDGKVITKKIDMPYDDNYFEEIMPISSNYYNDSSIIRIKNKIFNELIVNSQKTGDYGFEHDNLLYYVCRSGEFLKNNNSYTLLSTIEKILKKKTDLDCYVINKNEVTTIFFVKDKFDIENSWSTSTESIIIKLPRAFELLKQLNVKIDNVAIVDDHDVPRGVEVGKLKRNILSKYVFPRISDNMTGKDIDGFLENVLNEQLSELLDKDSNVKISGNTYHFSKVNFNIIDIFTIILNYNVSSFHEIDDEYILIVDNSFIDAKHPNDVIKKKDFYKLIHDYISKNQINNIKIDLNTTFNGLEIIIDNYKFEEIMDLEHYDLINFSDFNSGEEWVLFTYDASDLRYMVGKVRINDEGDYYVDIEEPAKDHLNIPFYFTVNEKDGKMVLEENYNLYFDENKGNKTYTLKKR